MGFSAPNFAVLIKNFQTRKNVLTISDSPKFRGTTAPPLSLPAMMPPDGAACTLLPNCLKKLNALPVTQTTASKQ